MPAALADGMLAIVKAATDPLFARIQALESKLVAVEQRPLLVGPQGPAGPPGADGTDGGVGPSGAPGRDGKDAEPISAELIVETVQSNVLGIKTLLANEIVSAVTDYLTAHPPTAGPVGPSGPAGPQGEPGAKGDIGEVGPIGTKGDPGIDGKDGAPGAPGRDGVGMADAVIDRDGTLVLTRSDGTTKALGVVVGATGAPGRDGVGFEDYDESYEDDGRILVRRFLKDGVVVKEFRHTTAQVIFRGVFKEGQSYETGDVVQFGNLYVAKCQTSTKPSEVGEGTKDWTLMVRRGRDGKQGPQGAPGLDGKPGKDAGYR